MKGVLIFILVASIIYLITELYSFVKHVTHVQEILADEKPIPIKYNISLIRQFGILFSISYVITFIII